MRIPTWVFIANIFLACLMLLLAVGCLVVSALNHRRERRDSARLDQAHGDKGHRAA